MADVILNRKEIKTLFAGGTIGTQYLDCTDVAYLPFVLVIDVIEKNKKNGTQCPGELKSLINRIPEFVTLIPLSSHGLSEALKDSSFCSECISSFENPFAIATKASVYEEEYCWDRTELLKSFQELAWI